MFYPRVILCSILRRLQVLLPNDKRAIVPSPTPEAIAACNVTPALQLRPEHIAVHDLKLGEWPERQQGLVRLIT